MMIKVGQYRGMARKSVTGDIILKSTAKHVVKSAIERQKGIYSHEPFVKIGEEVKRINASYTDSTMVRSHYRMQPCGPNLSKIKLVLVKEHERTYHVMEQT